MAAPMGAEPPLLYNQGLRCFFYFAAICSESAAKSLKGCGRSLGWAAYSPHPALISMQCQYGDFGIVSA
jgi:hypothetical protein